MYCEALTLRNKELKASSGKRFLLKAPRDERNDLHLIIKQEDHVVGTLLLHPISEKCVQIKQVAVDSRYQGAGLGKKFTHLCGTGRKKIWFLLCISYREKTGLGIL
ncbi:GNAT family N-acetyltransferase [Enterococcus gilvus]|uniref:GNAT family N-acetyltransferase n=1 Tax=Enterococcus gilvus TaxID=160453 RepID=UPI0021AB55D0|nr:GNAT family N-acetyltransferase [Enterococcus gilvus]